MRAMIPLIALLIPAIAPAATVNKCVGQDGKILFTQAACPSGQAAEELKIAPTNGMNNSANTRVGPSADKYVEPLDLSGEITSQILKIKAVVDVGLMKARDCDWDLKVNKQTFKCMDLLAYMIDGSQYSQAMARSASLSDEEITQVKLELMEILRAAKEINQAKALTMTYVQMR